MCHPIGIENNYADIFIRLEIVCYISHRNISGTFDMKNAKLTGDQQAMIDSSVGFFKDLGIQEGGNMLKKGLGSFLNG